MSFIKIQEGDLEAFITGNASSEVVEAIENSPEHQQKATEFEQVDNFLSALFTEVKPLNPQYLVDVASGQASANQRLIVAAHCRRDPEILVELKTLEASWHKMVAGEEKQTGLVHQIPSLLQSLFTAQPILSGELARNAKNVQSTGSQSHEVDGLDVTVTFQVIPAEDEVWQIEGRIVQANRPLAGVTVMLDGVGSEVAPCQTDQNGFFSLKELDEGTYTLYVALPNNIIEIPSIQLLDEDDDLLL